MIAPIFRDQNIRSQIQIEIHTTFFYSFKYPSFGRYQSIEVIYRPPLFYLSDSMKNRCDSYGF